MGVMAEPGLEMLIGILSVLKAGGAYLPIDSAQPLERVVYMLSDSRAAALLTTLSQKDLTGTGSFTRPILTIGHVGHYKADAANPGVNTTPRNVVYTIYTSGTSGKSKGALVEHGNLINYVCWFRENVKLTGNDRALLTSSFGFDLGYTSIYPPLLSGCQLHVIPRETYLSPEDLSGYIARHRITYIKVTPSLFNTLVHGPGFSNKSCPSLRLVVIGGEEIKLKDVEKAHAIGPHMEIMNHYGPTEAAIGCVTHLIDFSTFDQYVKQPVIGRPIDNMKAIALDRGMKPVPVGVPGQLCLSGAGVIRGYLNRPELTVEKFVPNPYITGEQLYLTGDLVRRLSNGTIEFLGRIDTQVKIRGYRIELREIERRLLSHEAIREAVVTLYQPSPGEKHICAYIVLNTPVVNEYTVDILQLREYLEALLPDYMIPSYFVTMEKIPLTANGKLNGKLLPEPEMVSTADIYTPPRDPVGHQLSELWREILEPGVEQIGIDDNFFQLGGHSLKAIMMGSKVHQRLNLKVSLMEIFKYPTIRGLAAHLKQMDSTGEERYISIEPVEEKEYYRLSSAQKRLFVLYRLDENSIGYNMPRQLELNGEIHKVRLENAFKSLVGRHESFRTSFKTVNDQTVREIHKAVDLDIQYYDEVRDEKSCAKIINGFVRPFDLSHAPLLRVGLIKRDGNRYQLMMDMHHIISDGASSGIISEEFMALYSGKTLSPLHFQYNDYAEWQDRQMESEEIKKQEDYWLKQFAVEIPVLDLPTDYERPSVRSFAGGRINFELAGETRKALLKLALENGATLYMVLFTLYGIFLSKITNQEDIVVGTVNAGRNHADLKKIVGMFVNTMGIRTSPSSRKTTKEFLEEVRQTTLAAFENQDYQFDRLVEQVAGNRDAVHNPLFSTMLVLQNIETIEIEIPGLKLTPYDYESDTSKFDLMLVVKEGDETLRFTLEYSTTLFEKETIQRFIRFLTTLVSQVLARPHDAISELEIITREEKHRILNDFNNTRSDYSSHRTIHHLFAEQAKRTPEQVALVGEITNYNEQITNKDHISISYRQLDRMSDGVARYLMEKGAGPDTIVGLMAERSVEMIADVLGILKAGGAYLPIDPDYPQERIDYML
ncbi:MAG: amino acid adenylation domain-containing protein, partial [bacterium]|nr:amino acid adenylation domain-containing protein [bacterium]